MQQGARRAAALTTMMAALAVPAQAGANPVVDWSATAIGVTTNPRTHTIMHLAVHDALNAVDARYEPFVPGAAPAPGADRAAAVAAAANGVLQRLVPSASGRATAQHAYDQRLAAIPDGLAEDAGVAAGAAAADAVIAARADDGFGRNTPYPGGQAPGAWRPTPPFHIPAVGTDQAAATPFVLRERDQFGIEPPHPIGSARYAAELEEVRRFGVREGSARTGEQTLIARMWGVSGPTLVSQWLRTLATERGFDEWRAARLFATALAGASDAVIATFHFKYLYGWWRPVTAIREADSDGDPATIGDPSWTPLLDTPPFPEHPSAHCAAAAATTAVLGRTLGTRRVALSYATAAAPGYTRSVGSLDELDRDCEDARVWAGVHFRFGDEQGTSLGRRAGQFAHTHMLRPLDRHAER